MVKNTHGGNHAKKYAHKNSTKQKKALRTAKEEGEIYAQAIKVMGGCNVDVIDLNGTHMRAHIRGIFRKRGKRDNFITPGTWLLVGLHSWENSDNIKLRNGIRNCDVLEVYSDQDKVSLQNAEISINWSTFILNNTSNEKTTENNIYDDFTFADDTTIEHQELINAQTNLRNNTHINIDVGDDINIDDI